MNGENNNKREELYKSAQECMRFHDISTALLKFQELEALEAGNTHVGNLMGLCYLILGEYDQAVSSWNQVLKTDPLNKTAKNHLRIFHTPSNQFWIKRFNMVLVELEKKNFEVGKKLLHELLEENDRQIKIYQLLGLCYLASNDKKNATLIWKKGLELDKSNPQLLEYLHSLKKDNKNSVNNRDTARSTNNTKSNGLKYAWIAVGVLACAVIIQAGITTIEQTSAGKSKPVISSLTRSDQLDKLDKPFTIISNDRISLGNETSEKEEMAGSPYDLEKEKHYYFTGRKAMLAKKWDMAERNFNVVVDMHSHSYLNREALYYMASAQFLRGKLDEAEQSYLKYLKQFPDSNYYDDTLYYLGCLYYKQNKNDKTIEVFSKLKELAPDSGYLSTSIYKQVMNSQNK